MFLGEKSGKMWTMKFISTLLTLSAVLVIAALLLSTFFGVYYLGDTNTYMQYGVMGGPLTTLIMHDSLWPPLTSMVYNLWHRVSLDQFALASVWVAGGIIVYVVSICTYLISLKVSKKTAVIVSALTIVGPISMALQGFLSEPMFLVFWILSLFGLIQFVKTNKEPWLLLWLGISALLPMSRYLGALLIAWSILVLLIKMAVDFKKKAFTYSPWLVLTTLALVWMPIAFYIFKTKLILGMPFPARDPQQLETFFSIIQRYISTVATHALLPSVVAFLFGVVTQNSKKVSKKLLMPALITLGSAGAYLGGLLFSQSKYLVEPHMPVRYIGLSFPFFVIASFLLGKYLQPLVQKKIPTLSKPINKTLVFSILAALFISTSYSVLNRLYWEEKTPGPINPNVAWTGDMSRFCNSNSETHLVYHLHSRNWAARSLTYFCPELAVENDEKVLELLEGTNIISAYDSTHSALLQKDHIVVNGYDTYLYTATTSALLDIADLFENRGKYE